MTDERVVDMLEKLQKEQDKRGQPLDEAAFDQVMDEEEEQVRVEIGNIVDKFNVDEVVATMRDLGESIDATAPPDQLKAQLQERLVRMAMEGQRLPDTDDVDKQFKKEQRKAQRKDRHKEWDRQTRIFRTTFIVAFLGFIFRLWSSGLLDTLWTGLTNPDEPGVWDKLQAQWSNTEELGYEEDSAQWSNELQAQWPNNEEEGTDGAAFAEDEF